MRILFVTSLYSSPLQPERGIPNRRIEHALHELADISVIVPLPYYPEMLVRNRQDLLATARVPFHEQDDNGVLLHPRYLHIPRVGRVFYPWLYAASIAHVVSAEIKRFKPDVLLSAWAYPDGVAGVSLAKLFGLPSVLRVMGSDINGYAKERLRRPQISWALRNATRVIAVSKALRDACVEVADDPRQEARVDVIPTGVDVEAFHPIDRSVARKALDLPLDRPVVLVPARLAVEKGVRYFIEALALLGDEVRAVLAGDGPELSSLGALVAELGLSERVRFAGHVPEDRMKLYFSAADLVCLPSTEEGWPNVLLESFACGCPWVASDVGGVSEMARVAPGAILARPADPNDLARALGEGLARSWDRQAIAKGGASRGLAATARAYLATCESAVASRHTANLGSPTPTAA